MPRLALTSAFAVLLSIFTALPVLSAAEGTLVVRVTDKSSGAQLPARLSVKAAGGTWRWGLDAAGTPLALGGLPRIWSTGTVTLTLPAGPAELVVSRPFAHRPATFTPLIEAGKTTEIHAALERVVDLPALGWTGGDIHVHIVHGEKEYKVDLNTVVPIARAEGQDWCSFGQAWTSLTDQQPTPAELSILTRRLCAPEFLCAWGMEHPKDHLGHMASFPLNAPKSYTEASGSNDYAAFQPGSTSEGFTHVEIWRGLRAHGSLAVYTHPTREYGGTKESVGNIARELPYDVAAAPEWLEALDVFCDQPRHENDVALAFLLYNRGLRFALCGFTDVCYDRNKDHERPGDTRTYVYVGPRARTPGELSMDEIVAAVRARRTFATTGPLVDFSIAGERPGAVLPAGPQERPVKIAAWMAVDYADPRKPVQAEAVELLRNGSVVRRFTRAEHGPLDNLAFTLKEESDAWYLVHVLGPDAKAHLALTTPIWFETPARIPPQPVVSRITATIRSSSGAPLAGTVRVIEYSTLERKELAKHAFSGGRVELDAPAAARLEFSAEGHEPQLLSPFLHGPIYAKRFAGIRRTDLLNNAFYDEVRKELETVELAVVLKQKQGAAAP